MAAINANGVRHFYRREGDSKRPVLVLAHPIGFDHGLWDKVVPALTRSFHVIRYDLRGHGGSEVTREPYSVDLLARDAAALLQALGVTRFAFAGTSLGGLVGIQLAIRMPDRMNALVVSNASARLPPPREEWDRRIGLAAASGSGGFVQGVTERMFSAAYRETDDPFLHTLIESFRSIDGAGYAAAMAALRDADLVGQLAEVRVRTLVVAGRADAAVPAEHSKLMADTVPGARLAVLDGGHLSAVESSAEFAREIASFCGAAA